MLAREVYNGTIAETMYYLYNGHADVTALVGETGEVVGTYYYDAFGNILEATGDKDNNIMYAGYQYDEETGLYYLNARFYDPKVARFLQEDTYTGDVQDPLSLNIYTYCYNNPLIYEDPSGHFVLTSILVAALIGTVIGATIGAGMDIGSQMLFEDKSFKELDWKSVGVSALEGGISGLIGGLTGGTSVAVTTGTAVVKATGKQIVKTVVKTAIAEGLLGATVNATSQYMVKGEVNWGDVAMSGIMDTVTGGLGSYLPNTKFGKGIVKFTNKVKDSISTGFKNISDKFDNALKKLGNAFSPEAVTPEGIRIKSPFGLEDVNTSNIKYTEVQANYNKVMAEMDVDANNSLALYDPDFAKYQENPSEYFKTKGAGKGVDIELKYKDGWTAAQKAEADAKVKALTEANTVKTVPNRSGTSASSRYKSANGANSVPAGKDVDHTIDLQLGGAEDILNMNPLDASVNRSLGKQIQNAIKDYPIGTWFDKFKIK